MSQMTGTQAVLNILNGERYKMCAKEVKDYLHGKYGKAPAPVNEEIKKKIIGDDEVITCRPADLLEPEFEKLKEKYKDIARSDEDVLSLALFEQVATDFLKKKYGDDEVDEAIKKKIIGDDEVITCRPADLLEPEFESLKAKYADIAKSDEDVLSLALFEQVATDFLKKKYGKNEVETEEFEMFV